MAVHGVSLQHHAITETAFTGDHAPTSANAVTLEELSLKPNREFVDIKEFQRTADKLGWIAGKVSGEWSCKHQARLGSAVDSVPELDAILACAFGTAATVSASTSVTYNQSTFDDAPSSIRLIQSGGGVTATGRNEYFSHQAVGAVVKKCKWTMEGGQPVMVEAEGDFADYGYIFGAPTTGADITATDTAVTLASGSGGLIRESIGGMYVQFGTNDNTAAGYRITTTTGDATTIATAGGLAGATVSSGSLVRAFIPSATYAGSHLDGVTGNLSIGGSDYDFTKAEIEMATGLSLLNKQATSAFAHRVGRSQRMWTGNVTMYLENEMGFIQVAGHEGTEYAVEFRFGGTTAGTRWRISLPGTRFNVINEFPFEEEDEGTEVTASFACKRTSGENAGTLIQD